MILIFFAPLFFYNSPADYKKGELTGYGSIVLSLLLIIAAIKNYRDKKNGGMISFGEAFGLGSEISGIAAVIFGIYIFALYKFIRPELADNLIDFYKNKIISSGQSQDVIARQLSEFNQQAALYSNPIAMAIVMMLTVFAIGLTITLISSLFLKRKVVGTGSVK